MANTYSQLFVQLIFAVKGRECLIKDIFRIELEKYICGIVRNNNSKPISIFCNPDHTHILIGLHPSVSIATVTGDIKACSSKWINQKNFIKGKFSWQNGYAAFSYSKSQIASVSKYILGQPEHHKKIKFKEEYLSILQKLEIEYNESYLFDWLN